MWLITGSVPEENFELNLNATEGESRVEDTLLVLPDGCRLPVTRGTTALAATAILACMVLGAMPPRLLLFGDCGDGTGSRKAYDWLAANICSFANQHKPLEGITFHYFYPDADNHNRVLLAIEKLQPKPVLVADAGYMYVAKMSGQAKSYGLFTPDAGELAFLADEKAPHPFYTRGFLLAEEKDMPALVELAASHGDCPANMIIKGASDYIYCDNKLITKINEPSCPSMECIGGTGDIVTGLATAWLAAGYPICKSAIYAARAARELAMLCNPTPATQVVELLAYMEQAVANIKTKED